MSRRRAQYGYLCFLLPLLVLGNVSNVSVVVSLPFPGVAAASDFKAGFLAAQRWMNDPSTTILAGHPLDLQFVDTNCDGEAAEEGMILHEFLFPGWAAFVHGSCSKDLYPIRDYFTRKRFHKVSITATSIAPPSGMFVVGASIDALLGSFLMLIKAGGGTRVAILEEYPLNSDIASRAAADGLSCPLLTSIPLLMPQENRRILLKQLAEDICRERIIYIIGMAYWGALSELMCLTFRACKQIGEESERHWMTFKGTRGPVLMHPVNEGLCTMEEMLEEISGYWEVGQVEERGKVEFSETLNFTSSMEELLPYHQYYSHVTHDTLIALALALDAAIRDHGPEIIDSLEDHSNATAADLVSGYLRNVSFAGLSGAIKIVQRGGGIINEEALIFLNDAEVGFVSSAGKLSWLPSFNPKEHFKDKVTTPVPLLVYMAVEAAKELEAPALDAMELAVQRVNADGGILSTFELRLVAKNISQHDFWPLDFTFLLAPSTTENVRHVDQPIAVIGSSADRDMSAFFQVQRQALNHSLVLSMRSALHYSSPDALAFRSYPQVAHLSDAIVATCLKFKWKRVALVREIGYHSEDAIRLAKLLMSEGIEIITDMTLASNSTTACSLLPYHNARIAILIANPQICASFACCMHDNAMTLSAGYAVLRMLLPEESHEAVQVSCSEKAQQTITAPWIAAKWTVPGQTGCTDFGPALYTQISKGLVYKYARGLDTTLRAGVLLEDIRSFLNASAAETLAANVMAASSDPLTPFTSSVDPGTVDLVQFKETQCAVWGVYRNGTLTGEMKWPGGVPSCGSSPSDRMEAWLIVLFTALAVVILLSVGLLLRLLSARREKRFAEAANVAQTAFLQHMSHDIRSPLTSSFGMSDLLLRTELSSSQMEMVAGIQSSLGHLSSIIGMILDLCSIESGGLSLDFAPFNIREAVEDSLTVVCAGSEKLVDIFYIFSGLPSEVFSGDLLRLKQVLVNLLSNSLKFTDSGHVGVYVSLLHPDSVVSWEGEDKPFSEMVDAGADVAPLKQHRWNRRAVSIKRAVLLFRVEDSGVGIPKDEKEKVLKAFHQVDTNTGKMAEGTGLGLAIVDGLVRKLGGRVWITDGRDGVGTAIHCTVVVGLAPTESPGSEEGHSYVCTEDSIELEMSELESRRVLICHPSKHVRHAMSAMVKTARMVPLKIKSLSMLLTILETKEISLMIVNLNDQYLNAADVELRKRNIPIILLGRMLETSTILPLDSSPPFLTMPVRYSMFLQKICIALGVAFRLPESPECEPVDGMLPRSPEEDYAKERKRLKRRLGRELQFLVVEDNPLNQTVLKMFLRNLFPTSVITTAANGKIAVNLVMQHAYDLVFMDLEMPTMGGLRATYEIIRLCPDKKPIICALTAKASAADRDKCLEVGMSDYLAKPVTINTIQNMVLKWADKICSKNSESMGPKAVCNY